MLKLQELKCNYEANPVGVTGSPVFGWKYVSETNNTVQQAYRLQIFQNDAPVFDSGRIDSSQSVCVQAEGFVAEPMKAYRWTVQIWDNHGQETAAWGGFEGALDAWQAQWIEPGNGGLKYEKPIHVALAAVFKARPKGTPEERLLPVTRLRKSFSVKPGLTKARAYATAHGTYQLYFNGELADDRKLAPEFSSYQKCLFYQIYDVTALLQEGENACGALLADGWWGGRVGMGGECWQYGDKRGFLLQLELTYADGTTQRIVSDGAFRWSDQGEIRYTDIFIGEMQDARNRELVHFSRADYREDNSWVPVLSLIHI